MRIKIKIGKNGINLLDLTKSAIFIKELAG